MTKKLIYTGKVLPNTKRIKLRYLLTREVDENGMVLVAHIMSGDEGYWLEQQYKKWFKEII